MNTQNWTAPKRTKENPPEERQSILWWDVDDGRWYGDTFDSARFGDCWWLPSPPPPKDHWEQAWEAWANKGDAAILTDSANEGVQLLQGAFRAGYEAKQ